MPQKIKYVGPKDDKTFSDFYFLRDVSDDATGGKNAVEVPDNVANAALKHRDVFMQWDKPVPSAVKALREMLPDALEKEGLSHYEHFLRRKVIAEVLITADSKAKAELLVKEIAGATAEMDHGLARVREAEEIRERLAYERGEPAPADALPQARSANEQQLLELVLSLKAEVDALKAERLDGGQPVGELEDIRASMQREVDKDLGELELPTKVQKALEEDGVNTIEQLAGESRETLLAINGVGPAAVDAIADALKARGLTLVGESSEPVPADTPEA